MDFFVTFLFGRRIAFLHRLPGPQTATVDDAVVSRRWLAFLQPGRPHTFNVIDQTGQARLISLRLGFVPGKPARSLALHVDGVWWGDLFSFARSSRILACGGCGYPLHDLHPEGDVLPCPECGRPHHGEYIREVHRTLSSLGRLYQVRADADSE